MRTAPERYIYCTPQQLVDQARQAFLMGMPLAAAMLARAAIDTRLNELLLDCLEAQERVLRRGRRRCRPTIGERAIALKKSGMFNLATQRDLIRLASIGGVAAHNDGVQLPEVIDLLAGAAAFVELHPTFEESRGLAK